jgi:hypothetical protein
MDGSDPQLKIPTRSADTFPGPRTNYCANPGIFVRALGNLMHARNILLTKKTLLDKQNILLNHFK